MHVYAAGRWYLCAYFVVPCLFLLIEDLLHVVVDVELPNLLSEVLHVPTPVSLIRNAHVVPFGCRAVNIWVLIVTLREERSREGTLGKLGPRNLLRDDILQLDVVLNLNLENATLDLTTLFNQVLFVFL